MRLFENYQTDTMSKKPKKRSLYKQNIFCSSELNREKQRVKYAEKSVIIINAVSAGSAGMFRTVSGQNREKCR